MLRTFCAFFFAAFPLAAGSCDDLAKLSLPHVTITRAETTKTTAPRAPYCRVAATLRRPAIPISDRSLDAGVRLERQV